MGNKLFLSLIFVLFMYSISFSIVSAKTFTEEGKFSISENDIISFPDTSGSQFKNYDVQILSIDLDSDAQSVYNNEPRVYFGGRGVALVLHEWQTGDILLNPVSNINAMRFTVISINLQDKTALIQAYNLLKSNNDSQQAIDISQTNNFQTENLSQNFDCVDSDGGISKYNFGKVSWNNNKSSSMDICISEKTLLEAYCGLPVNSPLTIQPTYCENGCANGRCLNVSTDKKSQKKEFFLVTWFKSLFGLDMPYCKKGNSVEFMPSLGLFNSKIIGKEKIKLVNGESTTVCCAEEETKTKICYRNENGIVSPKIVFSYVSEKNKWVKVEESLIESEDYCIYGFNLKEEVIRKYCGKNNSELVEESNLTYQGK